MYRHLGKLEKMKRFAKIKLLWLAVALVPLIVLAVGLVPLLVASEVPTSIDDGHYLDGRCVVQSPYCSDKLPTETLVPKVIPNRHCELWGYVLHSSEICIQVGEGEVIEEVAVIPPSLERRDLTGFLAIDGGFLPSLSRPDADGYLFAHSVHLGGVLYRETPTLHYTDRGITDD